MTLLYRISGAFLVLIAIGFAGQMDYEVQREIEESGWSRICKLNTQAHYLTCWHYDATGRVRVIMDHCC